MSSGQPGTYFSRPEHIFPLLEDGKIPTEQFLKACQGIADFVGFLGVAFSPVKSDIWGNVLKVKTKFETNPIAMRYVQDLVDVDLREHNGHLGIATEGLLWLKRGLEFMLQLLSLMVSEYYSTVDKSLTENPVNIVRKSYEMTLKRHHNFVSKQLFKLVIHAAPYRRDILKAVANGADGMDEICIQHIASHLDNFRSNVAALVGHYEMRNLESPPPPR